MSASSRPHARRELRIACAVDRDVYRQVCSGEPKLDRAHSDHDVYSSLREVYSDVSLVPVGDDLGSTLAALRTLSPDVVFNLARSATPYEPLFAGALEYQGLAYTGAGPLGIALSRDKVRSRRLLAAAGVDVPGFVEVRPGERANLSGLVPPLFVKPAYLGGCSRGIHASSVVMTARAARTLARHIWSRLGDSAVCDEFVVGRELRVGAMEGDSGRYRLLGVTESLFPRARSGWGFKTYAIRMNPRVRRAHRVKSVVPSLTPAVRRRIAEVARIAAATLDLRGYLALDLRIDEQGRCVVIEANANPGLTRRSLIWGRPSLAENLRAIVARAIKRAG
jgi:D-alanine-D-alanine ligase